MIRMSYTMNVLQSTGSAWTLSLPNRIELTFRDSGAKSTDNDLIITGDPTSIRDALTRALQHLDAFDRAVAHGYVDVTDRYENLESANG